MHRITGTVCFTADVRKRNVDEFALGKSASVHTRVFLFYNSQAHVAFLADLQACLPAV